MLPLFHAASARRALHRYTAAQKKTSLGSSACWFRPYSSALSAPPRPGRVVAVDCRSNGSITLDIHHATPESDASRIILYLPTGNLLRQHLSVDDDDVVQRLCVASQATVVRINYRLGDGVFYPTPVHDVLAGYDWVAEHLAPSAEANRRTGHRPRIARLGVCGQLVGGSLANMLALTECKMGHDRVAAAVSNSPIVDWIFPEPASLEGGANTGLKFASPEDLANELAQSVKRTHRSKEKESSWTANALNPALPSSLLLQLRQKAFRKAANWFDPFASPLLFFRTAGVDVSDDVSGDRVSPQFASNELDDWDVAPEDAPDLIEYSYQEQVHDFDRLPEPPNSSISMPANPTLTTRRRAHRVYPPQGSALRLPSTRIYTASNSVLHDQNVELAKLMQRSLVRTSLRAAGMLHPDALEQRDRDIAQSEAQTSAEKRVSLHVKEHDDDDIGLWGVKGSTGWQESVEEVGLWFRSVLK